MMQQGNERRPVGAGSADEPLKARTVERFENILKGGHPNSLGRTVEAVELVLANPGRMDELFSCYRSRDEVARLRVSNAMRRVQARRPDLVLPLMDSLIDEIGALDQPSAQWTLPKLFAAAENDMTAKQRRRAEALVRRNLVRHGDWIVLNNSIDLLARWAQSDAALRKWLLPHLDRLAGDARKSVSSRARKTARQFET